MSDNLQVIWIPMCGIFTDGWIQDNILLAMEGDKLLKFSKLLIKIYKPEFQSECVFAISSMWLNLKGDYNLFQL